MRLNPVLVSFLKFGGISGLGWTLDMTVLLTLVRGFGFAPFAANMASSIVAALFVFLLSRETVFNKAAGRLELRVAGYMGYILLVICLASFAMQAISAGITRFAMAQGMTLSPAEVAAAAKVGITPPQLIMNFLMSRFLSEREMRSRNLAHG